MLIIYLMKTYPICLINLENKKSIVVGGGKIALRKTLSLLDAGACVTVISPILDQALLSLVKHHRVQWEQRIFVKGDLKHAFMVIAATNDAQVNQEIWEEATSQGSLINVVDDPLHSNFILPAVVKRGELQVAISTGGSSPALARRLREKFETIISPEYQIITEILSELRPELIALTEPGEPRLKAALELVDSPLLEVIKLYGKDAALEYARKKLTSNHTLKEDCE